MQCLLCHKHISLGCSKNECNNKAQAKRCCAALLLRDAIFVFGIITTGPVAIIPVAMLAIHVLAGCPLLHSFSALVSSLADGAVILRLCLANFFVFGIITP